MSEINEDNYFKSKSNNNFCKQNNSQLPEGINNYKHCLPLLKSSSTTEKP